MSKVLVTGGGGFIGSNMVQLLLEKNYEVRAMDVSIQFDTNTLPEGAEIYRGSILDENDLMKAIQGCDHVFHFAAALGVQRTEKERLSTLDINILGTKNVLEACVRDKVKKIVFSSSSEVYGEPTKVPITENSQINPKSIYAVTKLAGEEYIKAYKQRYGLNFSIVRFFNVYGPEQVAEFVMPKFIHNVISSQPPVIYGDGSQKRAFCYVNDAVNGALLALEDKKADGKIFNIGNNLEPISMKNLAYKVIEIACKNFEPEFISIDDSDRTADREINDRVPDISKAMDLLGYTPKINLEQGIGKIMDYGAIKKTWALPTMIK